MNLKEYHQKLELKRTAKFEKRKLERRSTSDEILFILEKVLENWRTIKIFNVLIQQNPHTNIKKEDVENISTGNIRILQSELDNEKYNRYQELREKVYQKHSEQRNMKNQNK